MAKSKKSNPKKPAPKEPAPKTGAQKKRSTGEVFVQPREIGEGSSKLEPLDLDSPSFKIAQAFGTLTTKVLALESVTKELKEEIKTLRQSSEVRYFQLWSGRSQILAALVCVLLAALLSILLPRPLANRGGDGGAPSGTAQPLSETGVEDE